MARRGVARRLDVRTTERLPGPPDDQVEAEENGGDREPIDHAAPRLVAFVISEHEIAVDGAIDDEHAFVDRDYVHRLVSSKRRRDAIDSDGHVGDGE